MSAALLIELALKSVIIAGMTLALLRLASGQSAAQRSWLAHAGLAALLLLPLAVVLLPSWRMEALPAVAVPGAIHTSTSGAIFAGAATPSPGWPAVLQGAYAAGAGFFLILTLVSIARLFALRARSAVVVDAAWLTALAQAQRRMGVKYGAALLVNDEIRSPLSWGMLRPTILLNPQAVPLHADAEAIIAHELAHVVRLDWAKLLAARVATALFWFNPLVWILARQCHQLREEAADDAVLRADIDGADYAALLIGAARHECKGALLAAHGVAPARGSLKQRITRVLDEGRPRVPAAAPWAAACLIGAVFLAAPLSALTLQREITVVRPAIAQEGPPTSALPRPTQPARPVALASAAPSPGRPATPAAARPPRREDGSAPPFDPLAPDFGERIAAIATGTADTRGLSVPDESEYAAAGYPGLHQRQKTTLAAMGVTPGYMRQMAAAGYGDLTVDDLVSLRAAGVTADFARQAQRSGEPRPDPGDLIDLRQR